VLVLSPPWRTVLVLVIERFAVHGINATCVTAHKPPFPNERIMLLISIILSFTKFLPEQRVDRDGMIQSHDRSSTSTSTASLSTSTKNSQNKTMHRSGRSAALNFRNHFGGHSVMVAVTPRKLMTKRTAFISPGNLGALHAFREVSRIIDDISRKHEAVPPSLDVDTLFGGT
jgi:hypothetical protein